MILTKLHAGRACPPSTHDARWTHVRIAEAADGPALWCEPRPGVIITQTRHTLPALNWAQTAGSSLLNRAPGGADVALSMIAGRCLSGITHRDEEHRQSVLMAAFTLDTPCEVLP